ncbi:MAG: hypothetical protein GXP63_02325 [DPANN group archaeon]|nr:hypothetical protein [DPANN group archaeon]
MATENELRAELLERAEAMDRCWRELYCVCLAGELARKELGDVQTAPEKEVRETLEVLLTATSGIFYTHVNQEAEPIDAALLLEELLEIAKDELNKEVK